MFDIHQLFGPKNPMPNMPSEDLMISARGAVREVLENVPHAVRDTLVFFFAIFLLRILLRKEWLGALAFTLLFVGRRGFVRSVRTPIFSLRSIVYGSFALVTMRFGLLALATLILMNGTIGDMPASFDTSAWYYPYFATMLLGTAALVLWAFRQSTAGRLAISPTQIVPLKIRGLLKLGHQWNPFSLGVNGPCCMLACFSSVFRSHLPNYRPPPDARFPPRRFPCEPKA